VFFGEVVGRGQAVTATAVNGNAPFTMADLGMISLAFGTVVSAVIAMVLAQEPEIMLLEELHAVVFNNTYWKGWPSEKDPYVAPYPPWEAWYLIVNKIQPVQ